MTPPRSRVYTESTVGFNTQHSEPFLAGYFRADVKMVPKGKEADLVLGKGRERGD